MTNVLDDGQEDLWDSLEVDTVYDKIIFARRQKDGRLMIGIDLGGAPQVFIPNK